MIYTFSEVLEIHNGKNQRNVENKNGNYPIYGSGGIIGFADKYLCDEPAVIIGRKGSINNPIFVDKPFWNVDTAFALVPNSSLLDVRYLYYFCLSYNFNVLSTTVTIPSLTKFNLLKVKIEVPSLEEQKQIVHKLDKVEMIIGLKERQLKDLEGFIRSRFIEMFGDPLAGNAKWPIHNLCMVADAIDPQPSHRTPPIDENGIPYVSIKDCDYNTGKIDFEKARKVNVTVLQKHKTRYQIHNGDMMIGKIGTIGYPVILPTDETYTLSANVILIQPNKFKVQPYFLKYSLESPYVESQFDKAKHSTSQSAFGILKLRKIKVMNPELSIQNQFADFVHQVDKSKMAVQKSLDELETLKKSLMQTYFG